MTEETVVVTPKENSEPQSFEELRRRYDQAVVTSASLIAAITEKRAPYDEQIAAIEARWALENAELLNEEDQAALAARQAEVDLPKAILADYALDPTCKQVAPHLLLSIQARKEVVITDEEKMHEWAKAHPDFIIIEPDMKAIKDAAKNENLRKTLKMEDFIEIREKPVACIGRLTAEEQAA